VDIEGLKRENQALHSSRSKLSEDFADVNRAVSAADAERTRQLEARLKAQEDWKLEQDRNAALNISWKAGLDKMARDSADWAGEQAARTQLLAQQLSEQRDREAQFKAHSDVLEQRLAWQEKLANDQAEVNRMADDRFSETRRKANADKMQAVELEARLDLQEKKYATTRARNRALEARINELEKALNSTSDSGGNSGGGRAHSGGKRPYCPPAETVDDTETVGDIARPLPRRECVHEYDAGERSVTGSMFQR
jgi:BMFP domain-containing protein YqiC